jgi:hypothetical protein
MSEPIEIRSGMRAQGDALIVDWGQQQARYSLFPKRTWQALHSVTPKPKSPASIILALKDKVTLVDPDKALVPVELFKAAVEMAKGVEHE